MSACPKRPCLEDPLINLLSFKSLAEQKVGQIQQSQKSNFGKFRCQREKVKNGRGADLRGGKVRWNALSLLPFKLLGWEKARVLNFLL